MTRSQLRDRPSTRRRSASGRRVVEAGKRRDGVGQPATDVYPIERGTARAEPARRALIVREWGATDGAPHAHGPRRPRGAPGRSAAGPRLGTWPLSR